MPRPMPDFTLLPIAHRGLHDRNAGVIENSLSAIRAAAVAGYAMEVDVQLTADGEAVVFHDYTLDRLTEETGPVVERSALALGRIKLTGGRGDGIPTLTQALKALAGRRPIVVEIKRQPEPGPLESAVAAALDGYDGPAAVMSFDPMSILWFRRHAPHIRRGLVSCAFDDPEDAAGLDQAQRRALADLEAFEMVDADFLSYGARDLPRPAVARLRAQGAPTLCWTIRSPEEAARALEHVDAITFEGYLPPVAAAT